MARRCHPDGSKEKFYSPANSKPIIAYPIDTKVGGFQSQRDKGEVVSLIDTVADLVDP